MSYTSLFDRQKDAKELYVVMRRNIALPFASKKEADNQVKLGGGKLVIIKREDAGKLDKAHAKSLADKEQASKDALAKRIASTKTKAVEKHKKNNHYKK